MRRTKQEMRMMYNECESYLLRTKLNAQKAFELMVKECLNSGVEIPYYIKDIKDFIKVSNELSVKLNYVDEMKKSDAEIFQRNLNNKKLILDMSIENLKKMYSTNKDTINQSEKMILVDIINLKYVNELNEKLITVPMINLINKLNKEEL